MALLRSFRLEDGTVINEEFSALPPAVQAAIVPTSYVIDPTGTGPNVFPSLAAVMAATTGANLVQGNIVIEYRKSVAEPAMAYNFIRAGDYTTTIKGNQVPAGGGTAISPVVTFAAGSTLSGIDVLDSINIVLNGATPLIVYGAETAQATLQLRGNVGLQVNSTGAIIRATGGATLEVIAEELTQLVLGGAGPFGNVIEAVGAGSFLQLDLANASSMGANTVGQSGGGSLVVAADPASTAPLTQAGMPGGVLVQGTTIFYGLSSQIAYTDAVVPALGAIQVQAALDKVKVLPGIQGFSKSVIPPADIALPAAGATVVMTLVGLVIAADGRPDSLSIQGLASIVSGALPSTITLTVSLSVGPTAFTWSIQDAITAATSPRAMPFYVNTPTLAAGTYTVTVTLTASTASTFKSSGTQQSSMSAFVVRN